jgi:hypothetical protein
MHDTTFAREAAQREAGNGKREAGDWHGKRVTESAFLLACSILALDSVVENGLCCHTRSNFHISTIDEIEIRS